MAQIRELKLLHNTENDSDRVLSKSARFMAHIIVEFHPVELAMRLEYCIHLFLLPAEKEIQAPDIRFNWEECWIPESKNTAQNVILDHQVIQMKPTDPTHHIQQPMQAKKLRDGFRLYTRLVPCIGIAEKASNNYFFHIRFEK